MNFLNLRYFLITAEEMSITKAARRLYISQQALSAHIANLEKEFGLPLFNRSPSFSLTYGGKCLLEAGKQILEIRKRLDQEMDEILGELRGELRIGISYTRGQSLLPYILPKYIKRYPLMEIILKEDSSEVLNNLLIHGEIDLVLSSDPILPDIAHAIPLCKERVLLAVPRDFLETLYGTQADQMAEVYRSGVRLNAFADFPFIMLKQGDRVRTVLDEALYREGITPNILLETDNVQTAFALAGQGMGLTAYPEMFVTSLYSTFPGSLQNRLSLFPISDLPEETLYAGLRRFQKPSPAAAAFLSELQALIADSPFRSS